MTPRSVDVPMPLGPTTTASSPRSMFILILCRTGPIELRSFPTRRSSDLREPPRIERQPFLEQHRLRRLVGRRSEEHTSELQSRGHLVCRLLLEKKKMTAGSRPPENGSSSSNTSTSVIRAPHTAIFFFWPS